MDEIGIFDRLIGVHTDMVRHTGNSRCRTLRLILKTGVFNALLVTVSAALIVALFSGAGLERNSTRVGIGASQQVRLTHSWHPIVFAKAVLWLCPLTAIIGGSFGLVAGLAGGGLMYLRARRIRSTKRFIGEAVILGFLLACLFPFFDVWTAQVPGIRDLSYVGIDLHGPSLRRLVRLPLRPVLS